MKNSTTTVIQTITSGSIESKKFERTTTQEGIYKTCTSPLGIGGVSSHTTGVADHTPSQTIFKEVRTMAAISSQTEKLAFKLGYLQAISDEFHLDLNLHEVELTDAAFIGAAKDMLGILREELKNAEGDLDDDPWDDFTRHWCDDLYQAIRQVEWRCNIQTA